MKMRCSLEASRSKYTRRISTDARLAIRIGPCRSLEQLPVSGVLFAHSDVRTFNLKGIAMKNILAACASAGAVVFALTTNLTAQTAPVAPSPAPETPATSDAAKNAAPGVKVTVPANNAVVGAPFEGANSYTEAQARQRVVDSGFSDVSALAKDGKGIWRGTATKSGKQASIAVDFKGNVVAAN